MTSHELRWYRWLRRELAEELEFAYKTGRPRALSARQETEVFLQVIATPSAERTSLIESICEQMGVGYTTVRRLITEQATKRGARSLRAFDQPDTPRKIA
jgi:transposase